MPVVTAMLGLCMVRRLTARKIGFWRKRSASMYAAVAFSRPTTGIVSNRASYRLFDKLGKLLTAGVDLLLQLDPLLTKIQQQRPDPWRKQALCVFKDDGGLTLQVATRCHSLQCSSTSYTPRLMSVSIHPSFQGKVLSSADKDDNVFTVV